MPMLMVPCLHSSRNLLEAQMALQSKANRSTVLSSKTSQTADPMISNERPSLSSHRSYGGGYPKPPCPDGILKSASILIERKTFTITLRENPRGRFLRITEDVRGRYDSIIIPSTGLDEFRRVFDQMTKASGDVPGDKSQNPA
jgi:hypothetical protein